MSEQELIKICSAISVERLEKLINEYFLSTSYKIVDGLVYNSKGLYEKGIVKENKLRLTFYLKK